MPDRAPGLHRLDGQFETVERQQHDFGEQVGEGHLAIATARQQRFERMADRHAEVDLAERRVALDRVQRAEQAGDQRAIAGVPPQRGDIALDAGHLVVERLDELLKAVAIDDARLQQGDEIGHGA